MAEKARYLYDTDEIQLQLTIGMEIYSIRISVDGAERLANSIRDEIAKRNHFIQYLEERGDIKK